MAQIPYYFHHVAEEDLVGSTGYGYDDIGRDKLDAMFADYFKTEDAMVRPQLTSGTHAISTAFLYREPAIKSAP